MSEAYDALIGALGSHGFSDDIDDFGNYVPKDQRKYACMFILEWCKSQTIDKGYLLDQAFRILAGALYSEYIALWEEETGESWDRGLQPK